MKPGFTQSQLDTAIREMEGAGVKVMVSSGKETILLGVKSGTSWVDKGKLEQLPGVERVIAVSEPYKLANRKYHPEDSVITLSNGKTIGGKGIAVIAGPCSVETPEQIDQIARRVKQAGAAVLRGGAFKPRTSPYAFQGLEDEGLELLCRAGKQTGLPVVSEITDVEHIGIFEQQVDIIQVGARNMQNFTLLKRLGRETTKPILLKRGLSATVEEWLMSAEYVMASGNTNVTLCERGIRTFETFTRNTLDLSAVWRQSGCPICRCWWIPPTPAERRGWWSGCPWRPSPPEPTD